MGRKIGGTVLLVVAFALAVLAGIRIAAGARDGSLPGGSVFLSAGIAFLPIAVLVFGGLYLLGLAKWRDNAPTDMQQQRRMVELVRLNGEMSLVELAQALEVDASRIRLWVTDLAALGAFNGMALWGRSGYVRWMSGEDVGDLRVCPSCGAAIHPANQRASACPQCTAEFFRAG